jgi:hypothetical protein
MVGKGSSKQISPQWMSLRGDQFPDSLRIGANLYISTKEIPAQIHLLKSAKSAV